MFSRRATYLGRRLLIHNTYAPKRFQGYVGESRPVSVEKVAIGTCTCQGSLESLQVQLCQPTAFSVTCNDTICFCSGPQTVGRIRGSRRLEQRYLEEASLETS